MKTSRRAVSYSFVTTLRVATGVLVGAAAMVAAAAATVSLIMARRVVTPAPRAHDTRIEDVDIKAQTITLTRNADTELPGRYGLIVSGSPDYIKLGPVLSMTEATVTRKLLTEVDSFARMGRDAAFSGWYYSTPDDLQIDYTPELIGSSVGPLPAWLFSGSDTWVINVHGRGVVRAETLRAVPVFDALGFTSLLVSYRNDTEAPRSARGAYGLGSTEWRDIDAALGYARRHGAKRIILMGWSMGGAIVMQTLMNSAHATLVAGVILDSPVIDWREVLSFQGQLNRVPAPISRLAVAALNSPVTARVAGAEGAIRFDELDMLARASKLTVPMLILHSDDDGFVPSGASRALAKARPDLVTLEAFSVARHTKLWNYDELRWTQAITDWVRALPAPIKRDVPDLPQLQVPSSPQQDDAATTDESVSDDSEI